jgi:hypothetical protein
MATKKRKASAGPKCKRVTSKTGKTFRQCRLNGKLVATPKPKKRAKRA